MKIMKTKIFFMMVIFAGLLVGCDKDNDENEPIKPPIEQPEVPEEPEQPEEPDKPATPSTNDIIKTKIGDLNMIIGSVTWKAVAYGNGKYIAVSSGAYSFDSYSYISTSTDGKNWTTPMRVENIRMTGITYGNGKFVATGNEVSGGVYNMAVSTDGVNWVLKKVEDRTFGVTYGNGKFVAVGYQRAYTSIDGTTWKSYHFNTEPNRVPNDLNGIIYGNGKFVGVGIWGRAVSSTNGENWTVVQVGDYSWKSIAYGNGKYVAVGYNGIVMTSIDGVSWAFRYNGNSSWNSIIYQNGKFIAVGDSGLITTSIDGTAWTTSEQLKGESGNIVTAYLYGICAMP